MILAINVNAAVDRIFFIDHFVPNTHMRTQKSVISVGGKGLDSALVLNTLQAPLKAITFIAGKNGEILADLLSQHGIDTELIWIPGETRVANVIVETAMNRHSHITTTGYSVTRDDCDAFLNKIAEIAPSIKWAVMAGTLPPGAPAGFYREIIELLHQFQVKTLIDGFGQPIFETLPAHPDIVKMNEDEFRDTFKVEAMGMPALIEAVHLEMKRQEITTMIITCGKDGILAFSKEGVFHAVCPEVIEVNAAGAGDAVSGAVAYRLMAGDDWITTLTWAAATSAAVVLTDGTAECYMKDILSLYPQVKAKQIS